MYISFHKEDKPPNTISGREVCVFVHMSYQFNNINCSLYIVKTFRLDLYRVSS